MRRLLISAAAVALVVGCADNAILEVTLDLPPAGAARNFALIQARAAGTGGLLEEWSSESTLEGTRLRMGERERVTLSVEARGDQVERTLFLKVRFCESARCNSAADATQDPAEQHFALDRAFYVGEVTRFEHEITTMPEPCDLLTCSHPVENIDRCGVFGCAGGTSTSGCTGDDGMGMRHFCD